MEIKSLTETENELRKFFAYSYKWGRKQNDLFDRATDFIYDIYYFDELIKEIEKRFTKHRLSHEFKHYALNRWYNFLSAKAVENIFSSHSRVTRADSSKDKFVDFYIDKIPFDLKTTVYPKGFSKTLSYAHENKAKLISWLYNNQSKQRRKHFYNRLFIILHASDGEHWKLKAEIALLQSYIIKYLDNFNHKNLLHFKFTQPNAIFSDLIWVIK